jgi:hypothetical protein
MRNKISPSKIEQKSEKRGQAGGEKTESRTKVS